MATNKKKIIARKNTPKKMAKSTLFASVKNILHQAQGNVIIVFTSRTDYIENKRFYLQSLYNEWI